MFYFENLNFFQKSKIVPENLNYTFTHQNLMIRWGKKNVTYEPTYKVILRVGFGAK